GTLGDSAPSVDYAPSAANGMRIEGVIQSGNGNSGQPNRWEVYVGKFKNLKLEFYAGAGRTGIVNSEFYSRREDDGTVDDIGLMRGYDPSTGLLIIDAWVASTSG